MTITTILAAIGATALILHTAVRIPYALTELLRACKLTVAAFHELRAAITDRNNRQIGHASEPEDDRPLPENARAEP